MPPIGALRWRTGRLEDLGFPSWDRSMRIYGHLRPDRLGELPTGSHEIETNEWVLPVWITGLPAHARHKQTLNQNQDRAGSQPRSQPRSQAERTAATSTGNAAP